MYWHYVGGEESEADDGDRNWLGDRLEWLADVVSGFMQGASAVGEALLWVAAGCLLAFVAAWAIRRRRPARPGRGEPDDRLGVHLFNLDLSPESLPDDVPGAAAALSDRGDLRGALSLLYRGMLARFVREGRPDIPPGATEGECLALVESERQAPESRYFGSLTAQWMRLAYAHRSPKPETVRRLCRQWIETIDDAR